ncbi:MAG: DUF5805 domain-containing protein [Halobacteriaceae archaeon]
MVSDSDRVVVKTYVPPHQKDTWKEHADELDMSQSEFIRSMVQAGRRDFGSIDETRGETDSQTVTVRVEEVKTRLQDVLSTDEYTSWDELVGEALPESVETHVETALKELVAENIVSYSPRQGGYQLQE